MFSPALPVAAGLLAHGYCRNYEPQTIQGILSLLFGAPAVVAGFLYNRGDCLWASLIRCQVLYLATLAASIITYRLSPFHPLARYPGPLLGKVSRLWTCYIAQSGDQHRYHRQLFRHYGNVVRTGPNHLLILDAKAIPTILGPGKDRWRKGAKYKASNVPGTPGNMLVLTRPFDHAQRRKLWEHAFTPTSLKGYEYMLAHRLSQMLNALQERTGDAVDLSAWFTYFAFDFMGDLAFGSKFNMLAEGGDKRGLIEVVQGAAKAAEVIGSIGWFKALMPILPIPEDIKHLWALGEESIQERQAGGSLSKDIFFHILNEDNLDGHEPLDAPTLLAEATLVIVAGSDTTSNALGNVFFYLLTHLSVLVRLRAEIDAAIPPDVDTFDPAVLARLPFLQAVINETLRLQPALASGTQLVAPPHIRGSSVIADHVIPPGTAVQVPTYSLHRDPRYFWPNPEAFHPERWLVDANQVDPGEFRLNMQAYVPFSFGPTSCIGKNLAQTEIRMATAALLRKFDIRFAPGWDVNEWERNCKDWFSLTTGPLPVVLTPRA